MRTTRKHRIHASSVASTFHPERDTVQHYGNTASKYPCSGCILQTSVTRYDPWIRSSKVNNWQHGSRISHKDKMNTSLKCTVVRKQQPNVLLEMLRFIRVPSIVLILGNRLQFGAGNGAARCQAWHGHNTDDRVRVLRPIQASGKYKEAERQTLARENQNEQVRAHCPVVVDKARAFVALARRLLPRHAGFVDQKAKQDWSRYHPYTDVCNPIVLQKCSTIHIFNFTVFLKTHILPAGLVGS